MNIKKRIGLFVILLALLAPTVMADEPLEVEARAAILVDVNSGEVLFEQNADAKQYPASLTKIMTALLVAEHCDFQDLVEVKASAFSDLIAAGSSAGLKEGEILSVENLLYCMLVSSGNDAANVLAEYVGGTLTQFYDMMNQKAAELGCTGTHFANAHGLHNENHYTTARDLYRITREFVANDALMKIANTVSYAVPATNMTPTQRILNSTNLLISGTKTIKYIYSPARGIKTGTTTPAGYCLVSSAEKNGLYLVSVLLGAGKDETTGNIMSFVETKRMFEWGFHHYAYQEIVGSGEPVVELPVDLSQDADAVVAVTQSAITSLMPSDFDAKDVVITPWLYEERLTAPVTKGQVLGEADVSYDGRSYGRIKLVALSNVERSNFLYSVDQIKAYVTNPVLWLVIAGVIAAIGAYIVVAILLNRRRRLRRIRKRGRYL
ncbi:MAG: D-alanyl-D-alanine carboxypeptidase [Clostridiales bacterium]|nr:D-alanyl-D-alanine carboxypeptidase [Clostridiales bacterium]MDD7309303.1 D-alanyl-D-alanine carboxypeptidase [Eubacteriales bacterium]MDY5347884.1 D-alanyl-D-alanine carboxypeptidase family protein [Eubacteriales bacterium]